MVHIYFLDGLVNRLNFSSSYPKNSTHFTTNYFRARVGNTIKSNRVISIKKLRREIKVLASSAETK